MSEAFICLKHPLCTPTFWLIFILQTDASDFGLGTALLQKDNCGFERAISYASRALTDREEGFSVTKQKAFLIPSRKH